MKTRILLFTSLIVSFVAANAQKDEPDTIQMSFGKTRVLIFNSGISDSLDSGNITYSDTIKGKDKKDDKKFEAYWSGIEFGINGLMTPDNTFELSNNTDYLDLNYGKSWFIDFNFLEFRLPVYKKNVGFVTGIGLNFNNYKFLNKNLRLFSTDSISYSLDTITDNEYKKNKLNTVYLKVPILFEVNLPKHNNFHFLMGVYGSLLIASHTKTVYNNNGNTIAKNHELPYLNPLQYGVTGRIGIKGFTLFADYNLTTLFKTNKGPELYPVNMGIAIDF